MSDAPILAMGTGEAPALQVNPRFRRGDEAEPYMKEDQSTARKLERVRPVPAALQAGGVLIDRVILVPECPHRKCASAAVLSLTTLRGGR